MRDNKDVDARVRGGIAFMVATGVASRFISRRESKRATVSQIFSRTSTRDSA